MASIADHLRISLPGVWVVVVEVSKLVEVGVGPSSTLVAASWVTSRTQHLARIFNHTYRHRLTYIPCAHIVQEFVDGMERMSEGQRIYPSMGIGSRVVAIHSPRFTGVAIAGG
jgi:hypothetical protein